ncbi:MAG TPA: TrkA family potassium uptake protein [Planctomycetota bacterium]|nr:TrkA family potassium uptake protein [Planctomycetota bacterium]HRR79050.1 TrkA family potassium uptake protein [Planctomycetota bacterium]HRT93000.1 TrkA family potassium uptake protein [Planctomycetota bacterium]
MPRVAVFGLGQFGRTLAEALTNQGAEVMAFDTSAERVEDIKDQVAMAVELDSTDERALRAVGLDQVQLAIVTMGTNIEANILTSALLKQLGVPRIFARASTAIQERILRAIGVNKIINIEREMGEAIATTLAIGDVHRFFTLATGHSLVEVDVPPYLVGKTIEEMQLRQRHNVNVVAVKKRAPDVDERGRRTLREEISVVPKPNEAFEEGDLLILAGENADIQALLKG